MDDIVLPLTVNPAGEPTRVGATTGRQMEQLQIGVSMTSDDIVSA